MIEVWHCYRTHEGSAYSKLVAICDWCGAVNTLDTAEGKKKHYSLSQANRYTSKLSESGWVECGEKHVYCAECVDSGKARIPPRPIVVCEGGCNRHLSAVEWFLDQNDRPICCDCAEILEVKRGGRE